MLIYQCFTTSKPNATVGIGTQNATNLGMNYQDKIGYTGHTTDTRTGSAAPVALDLILATLATIAAFALA